MIIENQLGLIYHLLNNSPMVLILVNLITILIILNKNINNSNNHYNNKFNLVIG